MSILLNFIIALWIFRIIYNVFCFVNLWWVKEYRFDRMRIHLGTAQGKRILFIRFTGFHRSLKSIFLILLSLAVTVYVLIVLPSNIFIRLIVIDILLFPVVSIFVLILHIPTKLFHLILIYFATKKLHAQPHLLVIGITGSYGKTSTKEYLATILSQKYKVLKTSASKNSPIGIAEVVLSKLSSHHEIFVVEMGAYKKGEIAEMVRMTRPQIGIITAINEQHQDLFGSIVSTMQAKYELIEGLTGKQLAIMNRDNMYVREMMQWAKNDAKTVWAYTKEQTIHESHIDQVFQIHHQSQTNSGIDFILKNGTKEIAVHAPVFGIHQVQNITAAIAASTSCGMTLEAAAKGASLVIPVDRMMKPIAGINDSLFIDDTFNNNPEGAIAALDYLKLSKGKKILVFQPMVELGEYTKSAHERVGEYAASVCKEIFKTNRNYFDDFERGVCKVSKDKHAKVLSATQAAEYIRESVSYGDTVLFKGKEAAGVLALLK